MRNYLNLLGLRRGSDVEELSTAMNNLPAEEADLETDMRAIFTSDTQRIHYERVHLQYEAIAAAQQRIGHLSSDGNQWSRRLVEFDVQEDTLHIS